MINFLLNWPFLSFKMGRAKNRKVSGMKLNVDKSVHFRTFQFTVESSLIYTLLLIADGK